MDNFTIKFLNPYLLLLIIPALLLVLYTFFRINKRFRYSRYKLIALILSSLSVILAVLMLSGMTFEYDKKNNDNEIILLVDESYSNSEAKNLKNTFVQEAIKSNPENVRLGIVTFTDSFDYAFRLNKNLTEAYTSYIESSNKYNSSNNDSTDIAAAINYTAKLFTNKNTARIILLSDGIETDGDAIKAIKGIAMDGIRVDACEFSNDSNKNEIIIKEIKLPEGNIALNETISLDIALDSSIRGDISLRLFDNNEEAHYELISANKGQNIINIKHAFTTPGLHELKVEISSNEDSIKNNNTMYSFIDIEVLDRVLIIERNDEGRAIEEILDSEYKADRVKIKDVAMDINSLRMYDEIILANISNADMPLGFIELLNEYSNSFGGGILTVAGSKQVNGKRANNTYNRLDMKDTLYQEMLPVIAEDYTPPVGIMLVIDGSSSMDNAFGNSGMSKIEAAREAARAALDALDPRDYIGIVSFSVTPTLVLPPTPVVKRGQIEGAIENIKTKTDGTVYSRGLEMAGQSLKALGGVNKKRIILISDGEPSNGDNQFINKTKANYESNVMTSAIAIGTEYSALQAVAAVSGSEGAFYKATNKNQLTDELRKDLSLPSIRDYELKRFTPTIGVPSSILNGVGELPALDGFYGTKLKKDAKAYLVGEYGEPIYAAWKYGSSNIGSLMVDLNGEFSRELISTNNGQILIRNIVRSLFPAQSIRKKDIELSADLDNYNLSANISTNINSGEQIKITINKIENGNKSLISSDYLNSFKGTGLYDIRIKTPGIYEIRVDKYKDNSIIATEAIYKEINYSKEYNPFLTGSELIKDMAINGKGNLINRPSEIFDNLVMEYHMVYDPRYLFAGLIIMNLLLELIVSKFKFKWPHEIIKARREGK